MNEKKILHFLKDCSTMVYNVLSLKEPNDVYQELQEIEFVNDSRNTPYFKTLINNIL